MPTRSSLRRRRSWRLARSGTEVYIDRLIVKSSKNGPSSTRKLRTPAPAANTCGAAAAGRSSSRRSSGRSTEAVKEADVERGRDRAERWQPQTGSSSRRTCREASSTATAPAHDAGRAPAAAPPAERRGPTTSRTSARWSSASSPRRSSAPPAPRRRRRPQAQGGGGAGEGGGDQGGGQGRRRAGDVHRQALDLYDYFAAVRGTNARRVRTARAKAGWAGPSSSSPTSRRCACRPT